MQKDVLIIGCNGYVVAVHTGSGEEMWRVKLRPGVLGGSRGSDVSVLINDNRVYAGCNGRIYAIDSASGTMLWENDLSGIGFNEVALAMQGINTQFISRIEHHGGQ